MVEMTPAMTQLQDGNCGNGWSGRYQFRDDPNQMVEMLELVETISEIPFNPMVEMGYY